MRSRIESGLASAWVASLALALLAGAVLPGCGGDGVDSGGTGMTPPTLAVGPISGFGSIVVGGVHYDESRAVITDEDGQPLGAASLTLGVMTQIEGSAIASTANGTRLDSIAQTIQVVEQVVGPVLAVDVAASSLTVLGQKVAVTPDTVFAAELSAGLGALLVGDRIAVYGQLDPVGQRIVATRLEPRAPEGTYVLRAAVNSYDRANRQLVLGGVAVSLAELPGSALPEALPVGSLARARLRLAGAGGTTYVATSLRSVGLALSDREHVEIEGRITQFTSATRFSVDGVPVDAANASLPSDRSRLMAGALVEVEGRASAGTIVARVVALESEDGSDVAKMEIEGRITALDTGARTFVVRGVTISYAGAPPFEGGTEADLAVDRKVSVKGRLSPDRTTVVATSIEIEH
jgi:hypothetical protein